MARQQNALRGELRFGEPMSLHTSWRVGGPANRFYQPADLDDLVVFLKQLPLGEPLVFIGLGSNLLVRDGGIRGTVVCTAGVLDSHAFIDDSILRAGAGMPCAKVARIATRRGCAGAEFLAGIPGTLGGALAMNAGAFGGETWRLVKRVQTLDRQGNLFTRDPGEYHIGYREVKGPPGEWFVSADLSMEFDPSVEGSQRIKSLLARRAETQPMGLPSCGSVFRNPPGDHAGRLIEDCGLKGFRIGDAGVSEKHANFIINLGQARAADIEALIAHVQKNVAAAHGVQLIPEVKMIGEALP
jgi:UDP-N-acetylmuramate dehydrogenase